MRLRRTLAVLLVLAPAPLLAQPAGPEFPPRRDVPEILGVIAPLLIPKVMADTWLVRDYIRSDEFREFRRRWGDRHAVDAIFETAVRLCWNNLGLALLVTTAATMDHRRVGVDLPLLGPLVWLPLTAEFEEEFEARVEALPCDLYADAATCDRDKLQHFFGSAFLAYTTESREAAERVGEFVEWGEQRYIVEGAADPRDLRANHQGQMFGLALLTDRLCRPSAFLVTMLAAPTSPIQEEE